MLIDTLLIESSPGEVRAALLVGGRVCEVVHHRDDAPSHVGAIHLGRVRRVDPGMNAAFVDIGADATAFLRARDIAGGADRGGRIQNLIHEGALIPVQVTADGHAGKGASATTCIRLEGLGLDYRPAEPGIAFAARLPRRGRAELTERLETLLSEDGVVLTAASSDAEAVEAELENLRARWRAIDRRRAGASAPCCLVAAPDPVRKVLSQYAADTRGDIIVAGAKAQAAVRAWRKEHVGAGRIAAWREKAPLLEAHGVEAAIEEALAPRQTLPGGGELVIEAGETLTAVDVNSAEFAGKARRHSLDLNLEAATEIAWQLRLRGIGGAIVIDFLRMSGRADRDRVVASLRAATRDDTARCHVLGTSRLGLVEMTRQRLGPSLAERMLEAAPEARPRADVVALAALRGLARHRGATTLAAAPDVIAALRGRLAQACAEATAGVGGVIDLVPRPDWARHRFEFESSRTDAA